MDIYAQIAMKIIQSQEAIIGPVAIEQAKQVQNMTIDWDNRQVTVNGDGRAVLEDLIQKYKELFGHISVEVSREAVGSLLQQLPTKNLPESLK